MGDPCPAPEEEASACWVEDGGTMGAGGAGARTFHKHSQRKRRLVERGAGTMPARSSVAGQLRLDAWLQCPKQHLKRSFEILVRSPGGFNAAVRQSRLPRFLCRLSSGEDSQKPLFYFYSTTHRPWLTQHRQNNLWISKRLFSSAHTTRRVFIIACSTLANLPPGTVAS